MGCREEPPPPTAADVAGDMGEFLLGFAESLAPQLGFSDCVSDLNTTYRAVKATVDLFESGINQKNPVAVLKAFELISSVLKDVSAAIKDCSKDAAELAAKVSGASKALKGNAMAIIKVVVDDFIHIWRDRYEITDDCKTTAADWRAGDFEGAGRRRRQHHRDPHQRPLKKCSRSEVARVKARRPTASHACPSSTGVTFVFCQKRPERCWTVSERF